MKRQRDAKRPKSLTIYTISKLVKEEVRGLVWVAHGEL